MAQLIETGVVAQKNEKFVIDKGYKDNLPLWEHVRAAIRGKQGAITLLNRGGYFGVVSPYYRVTDDNQQFVDKRRLSYFARGRFFNATGRTHDAYVGMIEKITELSLPTQLEGMKENIDGEGSSLNDFAIDVASETLTTGRDGILVDPPNLQGGTLAQAQEATPKLVSYKAEQIGRPVVVDGDLVELPLAETYWAKDDGQWELKTQTRILKLTDGAYTSEVWRDDELYSSDIAMVNGSALDYIPFQFVGSEQNKHTYDRPVMFDLAHQNLGHFQLDCDNRENLHYHGQGMTNVYSSMDIDQFNEMNPNGLDVGAKGVNMLEQNDRIEILQIAATGAIAEEMIRDEKRMIMLGAQVVQDAATNQTLGAKEIEASASTSQLQRIAHNVSEAMTQAVKWAAGMVGANPDEVEIKLNDNFVTDVMTAQDVQTMFAMVQGGAATLDELNEVKRRANYTTKTNEQLREELDDEAPTQGDTEEVAMLKMEIDNLRDQLSNQGGN